MRAWPVLRAATPLTPIAKTSPAGHAIEAAKDAIHLLRKQGVESVVMLTGDSHETARAIAAELGIDEVRAELMPEDKVAVVKRLQAVDIAEIIGFIVTRPQHVIINELMVRPTEQEP